MRRPLDAERLRRFMTELGREADVEARVYFTGGTSAVLLGWRASTIDADIALAPESDRLFRAMPRLKETLEMNIELASPSDFIPELPGWQQRSPFILREGRLSFHHYDFYAQALAKIERGHELDRTDVREMLARRLIDPQQALRYFEEIEPKLHRYPAINPAAFRRAAEEMLST
jgi:uncharacterized nucleotidyltransferase DUF6036